MSLPIRSFFVDNMALTAVRRGIRHSWRLLLALLGLALAWHAVRGLALAEAWGLLARHSPFALVILLAINLLILPVMTSRWWLFLRALGSPVGLFALCLYRFAANAVSYLTPGPHFGGEPLLVYLLHQRQGISLSAATTSVALDRILELWASIVVLTLSLLFWATIANTPFTGGWALPLALSLLAVLAIFLAALFSGHRPLSRIVSPLKKLDRKGLANTFGLTGSLLAAISQGEAMAETLLRRHRGQLLLANLFSLAQWLGVFVEFWLMAAFLGHPLSLWQLTAIITTARLAFLTPLPAGLGVLESALPWMAETLGLGSVLGLSLCLIIRFRDLLFSLTGLGLTMKYLTCPDKASTLIKSG